MKRKSLLVRAASVLSLGLAGCASAEPLRPPVDVMPIAVPSPGKPSSVVASPNRHDELEAVVRTFLDGDEPNEGVVADGQDVPAALDLDPDLVVGARHIVVMYASSRRAPTSVTRDRTEAKRIADQVLAKVKQGMSFASAAAQFSDEPGAAKRGGDLGTFKLGVMVPEFSNGVGRMRVGEVRVVESPFGFHVVERTQ